MTIRVRQKRIRAIAERLQESHILPSAERDFLVNALRQIAEGEDANKSLDVIAKRGERKRNAAAEISQKMRKQLAMAWIAAARLSENEGGFGYTLDEACAVIGENKSFGLTENVLQKYWNKTPSMRQVTFKLDT